MKTIWLLVVLLLLCTPVFAKGGGRSGRSSHPVSHNVAKSRTVKQKHQNNKMVLKVPKTGQKGNTWVNY